MSLVLKDKLNGGDGGGAYLESWSSCGMERSAGLWQLALLDSDALDVLDSAMETNCHLIHANNQ